MPQSVANNINLGWNYATGQVVQPRPQSAPQIAPIQLPPMVQTQGIMPQAPKLANPTTALPGQKYDWGFTPMPISSGTGTGIGALAQLLNPVTAMSPKPATVPTVAPKTTVAPKATVAPKTTVAPKVATAPVKAPVAVKTK